MSTRAAMSEQRSEAAAPHDQRDAQERGVARWLGTATTSSSCAGVDQRRLVEHEGDPDQQAGDEEERRDGRDHFLRLRLAVLFASSPPVASDLPANKPGQRPCRSSRR